MKRRSAPLYGPYGSRRTLRSTCAVFSRLKYLTGNFFAAVNTESFCKNYQLYNIIFVQNFRELFALLKFLKLPTVHWHLCNIFRTSLSELLLAASCIFSQQSRSKQRLKLLSIKGAAKKVSPKVVCHFLSNRLCC